MPSNPEPSVAAAGSRGILNDGSTFRFHPRVSTQNNDSADDVPGPSLVQTISNKFKQNSRMSIKSLSSVSSSEFGHPCRICRCDEENVKVVRCPCKCKGSVGFVHINCLKQWILHHRGSRCEICNTHYRLPDEQLGFRRMVKAFFSARCAGLILKHLVLAASIIPLARVILHQVLTCMDKLNPEENAELTFNEVLMASCALLTSSALFFNFFEYITRRFLVIRNIIRQWWMFGDFELMNPETLSI